MDRRAVKLIIHQTSETGAVGVSTTLHTASHPSAGMAKRLVTADAFNTLREDFECMIRVAWWAIGFTTGTALLAHSLGWLPLDLPAILLIAAGLEINSWAAVRLAPRVGKPLRLYFGAHFVNVALVTLAIHFVGGVAFLPGPLFYALIVVNGGIVGSRPAYVLAFACTVAYAALLGLEASEWLPAYHDPSGPIAAVQVRAWPAFVALVGVVLHVIAAYAGRLAAIVRRRGIELADAHEQASAEAERRRAAQAAAERAESDVTALRDLTDRYRTFVQIVTHDLKNPINAIYLTAEQLLAGTCGELDPRARARLRCIRDMSAGAEAMIFDLINLFRVVSKRETTTWVPLADVVQEALATIRDTIQAKSVHVNVATSLPVVWGQPDKVLSAVTNVLTNAVKYVSRQDGWIRVSGEDEQTAHLLTIEDNGIGIPVDYHERIFELFARLPNAHQEIDGERVTGTGVGLALARRIMDLHHGTICVREAVPRGSCFELRFPLRDRTSPSPDPDRARRPLRPRDAARRAASTGVATTSTARDAG